MILRFQPFSSKFYCHISLLPVIKLSYMSCGPLVQQYGLVFVSNDAVADDGKNKPGEAGTTGLVTPDAMEILKKQEGNLGMCQVKCQILPQRKAITIASHVVSRFKISFKLERFS